MAEREPGQAARNVNLFRAAWQKSIETELRIELHKIAKTYMDKMYQEMNRKALETVANIQSRLILDGQMDKFHGAVTLQLLLPKEMTENPPDGGHIEE